ncbi:MAG: hypothetical protein ACU84H_11870 [Gammaproteobacteria bacterium]
MFIAMGKIFRIVIPAIGIAAAVAASGFSTEAFAKGPGGNRGGGGHFGSGQQMNQGRNPEANQQRYRDEHQRGYGSGNPRYEAGEFPGKVPGGGYPGQGTQEAFPGHGSKDAFPGQVPAGGYPGQGSKDAFPGRSRQGR